ncbi:DnaT-like ssDNA-binding domain-containing protein [Carnimonas bestiolae]|uniref:DnaT-like ssDNA-binding domain-containing protein n=1 Tax=Carnimonas bestiolae TaxID=3402172 RepID=UPI003EDC262A
MQFSVLINQAKALEWGLNMPQAMLFAFVYECPSWCKPVSKDDEIFYALSKQKVVDELPLLGAPDTVYRNLKVLAKRGVIELSYTNQITLVRLTDKGRQWNKKTASKGNFGSEKNPTNGNDHPVGKKSDPARGNIRSGSEKNPTNQVTSQLTPSLSEGAGAESDSDEHPIFKTGRDDDGGDLTPRRNTPGGADQQFSMHRDWVPNAERLDAELHRRGMPLGTTYEPGWLADFTAHYADKPGLTKSESGWLTQFAKWIQQNDRAERARQQSQQNNAGGNRHENRQPARRTRRTAAEARAAAEAQRLQQAGSGNVYECTAYQRE